MEYPKVKYFRWFFNEIHGIGEGERIDDKTVRIEFKNLLGEKVIMNLPVDIRDKRILITFDGGEYLLPGSIPKVGQEITRVRIGSLSTRIENARKDDLENPFSQYRIKRNSVFLDLFRHFLLVPCGKLMVQRFDDKRSLSPVYSLVHVRRNSTENGKPIVEWLNTDS